MLTAISDQNEDLDEDILPLSIQLARVLIIYSIGESSILAINFHCIIIRDILSPVLPRLNKRKKTASEILKPLMTQVQGAIPVVSQQSEVDVQAVLDSLLILTRSVPDWIGDDPGERNTVAVGFIHHLGTLFHLRSRLSCMMYCKKLFNTTLMAFKLG